MALLDLVKTIPNICIIEFSFTGVIVASNIQGWQPFFNSRTIDASFTPAHFGKGSVAFNEESVDSPAGVSYKQVLSIRFPVSDTVRAERIDKMQKVKLIKIRLTNGNDIVLGRNDYYTNARMKVKSKSNHQLGEIVFETQSITPVGYVATLVGLPGQIPLILV